MMAKTIMVVDDEKRLVSLVESYLTQEGYRVVSAYNGREALAVANREKPDLSIRIIFTLILHLLNILYNVNIHLSTGSLKSYI